MKRACLVFAVAGCASEPPDTINYTGETRRFAIDQINVARTNTEARAFGTDLNGDRTVDNQLGMVISTQSSFGNITDHGPDMIASAAIASSVELVFDDPVSDETVALRYFGNELDEPKLVGGTFSNGTFETRSAGAAAVSLPVFVDADPVVLPLLHARAKLTPDGRGGYEGWIYGAVVPELALEAAFAGVHQMIEARPGDHLVFHRMIDTTPRDYMLTQEEFNKNSLIQSLFSPDVTIDGDKMLSIGFRVHLSPCADGQCTAAPPAAPCFDRVRDGDETDIDCGGSCGACASGLTCADASDCQSGSCNGTCAEASCFNGVRDGYETDIDCGSLCGGCATGADCISNADCASGQCGLPCSGTFCGEYSFDTCRS
ncbi:MAG TPA: hypothetical protein VIV11_22105 [Kofleriaceae bacterium]